MTGASPHSVVYPLAKNSASHIHATHNMYSTDLNSFHAAASFVKGTKMQIF